MECRDLLRVRKMSTVALLPSTLPYQNMTEDFGFRPSRDGRRRYRGSILRSSKMYLLVLRINQGILNIPRYHVKNIKSFLASGV